MSNAAIIYWSGTGNTKAMAEAIKSGMEEAGGSADIFEVSEAGSINLNDYERLAFGCPSMGDEVLEEAEFEPYFTSVEEQLAGKKVALFGSYGWGDGEWMRNWAERVKAVSANLYGEGLIVEEAPDEALCIDYGKGFSTF